MYPGFNEMIIKSWVEVFLSDQWKKIQRDVETTIQMTMSENSPGNLHWIFHVYEEVKGDNIFLLTQGGA